MPGAMGEEPPRPDRRGDCPSGHRAGRDGGEGGGRGSVAGRRGRGAPRLQATSDAALIFYGASMLLAAVRGYAGCEVLAVSNWLLRRDDQVGCVVFAPVDLVERSQIP